MSVRVPALARIADPVLRRRVAPYVAVDALDEVTDTALLAHIAANSQDSRVRAAAARRITDERHLVEILQREKDKSVRHSAVINSALKNQELLSEIAMHDPAPGVRVVAALKLDDQMLAQRVYAQVAQADGDGRWLWGEIAVRELTDQALLAKIAVADRTLPIRSAAVARLEDQALLARIAVTDQSYWIRVIAARRLSDRTLLSRIGKNDPDWWVRQAAQERLKELRRRR